MAFNLNSTFNGLATLTVSIPSAGSYELEGKLTLPNITAGDATSSACVVTIVQTPSGGGPTTIYTGPAGARGFGVTAICATGDTLAITTSSAAAVDQTKNSIKTTVSVG